MEHIKHIKQRICRSSQKKSVHVLETGFKSLAQTCIEQKSSYGIVKILVLGDEGTGKTTICKKYIEQNGGKTEKRSRKLSNEMKRNERKTSDSVLYDRKISITKNSLNLQYDLELYDFQGNISRKNAGTYKRYLEECDGFLLVYSQNIKSSFMAMIEIIYDIHRVKGKTVPIVIAGNKSDCYNSVKDDVRLLRENRYNVCAIGNEGIEEIFEILIKKCIDERL